VASAGLPVRSASCTVTSAGPVPAIRRPPRSYTASMSRDGGSSTGSPALPTSIARVAAIVSRCSRTSSSSR
jgi:hypothetical protein